MSKKLTKKELRATQFLVEAMRGNGIPYETAVDIVGMRLTHLRKFSIQNVEKVFSYLYA
ncbi:hypothetical protein ACFXP9_06175 [Paracoccus sp. p1-h21]|uniref:hypothetical protein n=1 Tax=Paracoccus sp. p1-h21 TaxID=3366951 RepID=UPI003789D67D